MEADGTERAGLLTRPHAIGIVMAMAVVTKSDWLAVAA